MGLRSSGEIRSYRDLLVWQRAIQVIKQVYQLTSKLPACELYGIVSQMRRAAISIAANTAEGHARRTTRDYLRFLGIATGSVRELEAYCDIVMELDLLDEAELARLRGDLVESGKMLIGLRRALEKRCERSGVRGKG